ncbi:MAG: signal peptidase I [Candidatus Latescibacterota bacterium]
MKSDEIRREAIAQLLKDQLSAGKDVAFRVIGDSMEPVIRLGDQVFVRETSGWDLSPGDVILYRNGSAYCTHRFVRRFIKDHTVFYLTKGDRFRDFDIPFTEDRILGKVVATRRKDHRIDLARSPLKNANRLLGRFLGLQSLIVKCLRTDLFRVRERTIFPFLRRILLMLVFRVNRMVTAFLVCRNADSTK